MKTAVLKQIILVTDGQSNIGGDPVLSAKHAYSKNIIVNTIGILNSEDSKDNAYDEVMNIARAGGGQYEYTHIDYLYQTMKSMTIKTVNQTIQQAVNKQLKEILGQGLEDIEPKSRGKLLNYIEEYSSEIEISCCILMDCSGSMSKKLDEARYSVLDLVESLSNRKGKANVALIAFPGRGTESCEVVHNFTEDINRLKANLYETKASGGTPTAPAIEKAISLIEEFCNNSCLLDQGYEELEECYG